MNKEKRVYKKEQVVVKMSVREKKLLSKMAVEQEVGVEKFIRELIFGSGIICCR